MNLDRRNMLVKPTPEAKLTEQQVSRIRDQRARGLQIKALAKEYEVTYQLISRISRGEIWAHVPGPITQRKQGGRV